MAPPAAPSSAQQFFSLAKFLVNVIVIQLLGYVLKTIGAITPITEAGIGHYVGTIAFPCVLFKALATIDAQGVHREDAPFAAQKLLILAMPCPTRDPLVVQKPATSR